MYNTPTLDDLDDTQRAHFSEFVQWFFSTVESVNFTGGAYAPCDQWWEHPEAVSRLVGLWAAYSAASLPVVDESGQVTDDYSQKMADTLLSWWREVDHHKVVLFEGKTSPFSLCSGGKHREIHTAVTKRWEGSLVAKLPLEFKG